MATELTMMADTADLAYRYARQGHAYNPPATECVCAMHVLAAQAIDAIDHYCEADAMREGWAIFHCDGSMNGEWQIQALDDDPLSNFYDDMAVWDYLVMRAYEGSLMHLSALRFIRANNPLEWEAIEGAFPRARHVINDAEV